MFEPIEIPDLKLPPLAFAVLIGPFGPERPSFPQMGMATAKLWALRSADTKVQVGACLLDHWNRVVGVGYNGRAAGEPNEREDLSQGNSGFLHAEINCLLAASWSDGMGHRLFVTHEPCATCARAIINSRRIRRVVYDMPYVEQHRADVGLPSGADILRAAGIEVVKHEHP